MQCLCYICFTYLLLLFKLQYSSMNFLKYCFFFFNRFEFYPLHQFKKRLCFLVICKTISTMIRSKSMVSIKLSVNQSIFLRVLANFHPNFNCCLLFSMIIQFLDVLWFFMPVHERQWLLRSSASL